MRPFSYQTLLAVYNPEGIVKIVAWVVSSVSYTLFSKYFRYAHVVAFAWRAELILETHSFQDKPIQRTGQKSALQHSLFWRYASFSKINADHTFIHDKYISVFELLMFYIQKMW